MATVVELTQTRRVTVRAQDPHPRPAQRRGSHPVRRHATHGEDRADQQPELDDELDVDVNLCELADKMDLT